MQRLFHPITLAALAVLAFALRCGGAVHELWIDEIWSLELVQQAASPLSILSNIRHDNNHHLNSLFLLLLGGDQPWFLYRLPAVVAGSGAVVAAIWIMAPYERIEQVVGAVLTTTCYLLIHYSSEARGYAFAVLFALLAFKSLSNYLDKPLRRWNLLFVASAILGVVSHLSFLYVYAAALCWSLARRPRGPDTSRITHFLRLHTAPLACATLLYWLNLRGMVLGGGPPFSAGGLLVQIGSLMLGGPSTGPVAYLVAALAISGMSAGLLKLWLRGRDEWIFFSMVVLFPLAHVLVTNPPFMFVRYFLLAITFGLLLCCHGLAWLWGIQRIGKPLVIAATLTCVVANMLHYEQLRKNGRGQYLAALELMTTAHADDTLTISGDHDHGLRKLVEFYSPYFSHRSQVEYCDADKWPAQGVDWLVLHEATGVPSGPRQLLPEYSIKGQIYRYVEVFDSSILSGWRWHCYQRVVSRTR